LFCAIGEYKGRRSENFLNVKTWGWLFDAVLLLVGQKVIKVLSQSLYILF
jgi:hypothetical protein